jgi:5'-nucleotidase
MALVLLALVCTVTWGAPLPRILVTNDDGIGSQGIAALVAALKPLGEVVVVAPASDQSGASHSISVLKGVSGMSMVTRDGTSFGQAVNGTPADCVLTAIHWLHRERPFDLVVSGINHGTNVGAASLYSGTVGATVEAALSNIPAIAYSQDARRKEYEVSARIAAMLAARVLKEGLAPHSMLNVNVPAGEIKGIRVAPMGDSMYVVDRFEPDGEANDGSTGLTLKIKRGADFLPDSDTTYYAEGYVTVAPLQVDWTARESLERIRRWSLALPESGPPAE